MEIPCGSSTARSAGRGRLRLKSGVVARTVELTTDVSLDVDGDGLVLGAEFVNADDFLALVRQQAGRLEIPERVAS